MATLVIDGGRDLTSYYFVIDGSASDNDQDSKDQTVRSIGPLTVISGLVASGRDEYTVNGPILDAYMGDGDAKYYYEGSRFTSPSELISMSGGDQKSVENELMTWAMGRIDGGQNNGGLTEKQKNLIATGMFAGAATVSKLVGKSLE